MSQTITEWKLEGQAKLRRYRELLNKNDKSDSDIKELEYITKKFGNHPLFVNAGKDNYDRRAMHPGFGSPDCNCHVSPPCQNCIDWTNACDDRLDNGEPGCLITGHDCEIGRGEFRA